jgi:hypothetical protein
MWSGREDVGGLSTFSVAKVECVSGIFGKGK